MRRVVLRVVQQCVQTEGVEADYVRSEVLPDFFKFCWVRRMTMERRNADTLVATTVALAKRVGAADILSATIELFKDESEPMRRMTIDSAAQVLTAVGAADVNVRLEERLVDGILYCFQEQTVDKSRVMLNAFGAVIKVLGVRVKPYLPQVVGIVTWRLNNKVRTHTTHTDTHTHRERERQRLGTVMIFLYFRST